MAKVEREGGYADCCVKKLDYEDRHFLPLFASKD
jgi:hypothetical protein